MPIMIMIGRGGIMMGFGIVVGDGKGCSDFSSYYTGMWRDMPDCGGIYRCAGIMVGIIQLVGYGRIMAGFIIW